MIRGSLVLTVVLALTLASPNRSDANDEIDYDGLKLRSGQIVVGDGFDALSLFLSLTGSEFSSFTHSGVIVIENGHPFVYESVGKMMFWRSDAPTDATKGQITKTALNLFLTRQAHVEIYDPPEYVDRAAIIRFVTKSYRDEVPFDPYFGAGRDSYYCTEFVAYALEAGGQPTRKVAMQNNPSLNVIRRWLSMTDAWILPASTLIDSARYAGTLTSFNSRSTYIAYRYAKEEIHRRFTNDQKLGNIFLLKNKKMQLRPTIETFFERAMDLFPNNETPFSEGRINSRIKILAENYFGPTRQAMR